MSMDGAKERQEITERGRGIVTVNKTNKSQIDCTLLRFASPLQFLSIRMYSILLHLPPISNDVPEKFVSFVQFSDCCYIFIYSSEIERACRLLNVDGSESRERNMMLFPEMRNTAKRRDNKILLPFKIGTEFAILKRKDLRYWKYLLKYFLFKALKGLFTISIFAHVSLIWWNQSIKLSLVQRYFSTRLNISFKLQPFWKM